MYCHIITEWPLNPNNTHTCHHLPWGRIHQPSCLVLTVFVKVSRDNLITIVVLVLCNKGLFMWSVLSLSIFSRTWARLRANWRTCSGSFISKWKVRKMKPTHTLMLIPEIRGINPLMWEECFLGMSWSSCCIHYNIVWSIVINHVGKPYPVTESRSICPSTPCLCTVEDTEYLYCKSPS